MNHDQPTVPASYEEALRQLAGAAPPDGLADRVLQAVHQRRGLSLSTRRTRAWWAVPAFGLTGVAAVLLILALAGVFHRDAARPPESAATNLAANRRTANVSAPISRAASEAQPDAVLERRSAGPQRVRQPVALGSIAPPVLPLSRQERLLVALASRPALAAAAIVSTPVPDHGLGANALSDLEEEPLPSMQAALHDFNATDNPLHPGEKP